MTELKSLLRATDVTEKEGILVDKHIAETTVWDKLAKTAPTHAVISAPDEAAAARKSEAQIAELQAELNDGVILDLGCGYGRVAKYLLPKRTFVGYIGMDSAYNMLSLFRERHESTEAEQQTPVLYVNADIHTIPLLDASVDNVIVCAVFLHNHKSVVRKSIDEIYRVLKPGGKVFVYSSFPNKWSLMGLQGGLYQILLNLTGNPFKNGPVRYYGMKETADLFDAFGEVTVRKTGFALIPKRLIFLPGFLDRIWRVVIANPLNAAIGAITPQVIQDAFPNHFDVFVRK